MRYAIMKEYELAPTRLIVTQFSYDFIPRVKYITAPIRLYQTSRIQDNFPNLNNSYPDFHPLASNAKQIDLLLQSQIYDNIEYVSISKATYVGIEIRDRSMYVSVNNLLEYVR